MPRFKAGHPKVDFMRSEARSEQAFILHVWREKSNGAFIWRGSLTDAHSGQKTYFQSLPGLMELIAKFLEAVPPQKGDQTKEKTKS